MKCLVAEHKIRCGYKENLYIVIDRLNACLFRHVLRTLPLKQMKVLNSYIAIFSYPF